MYFEIVVASGGYRWRIRNANHEILAASEVLLTRAECRSAVEAVKAGARNAPVYEV